MRLRGAAIALLLAAGTQQMQAQTRHLHGVLEDAASSAPVSQAEITVSWGTPVAVRRARSDRQGRFDFRDLPALEVTLRVRALGFEPMARDVDLRAEDQLLALRLQPAVVSLAEVAVRADTLAEALERVTAVSTIDRSALEATRGQTLGETIRNLPGVSVIQFGPSVAKPVIRGLNSQRVLVLNAGVRQEDQQWGTEHAPNLDSFEADAVTVVRGAATVLYGADALGGVVRMDHAAVPDTGAMRGDVSLNGFSNSRQGALSVSLQGGGLSLPLVGQTGYRLRVTSRVAGNGASPDYFLSNTGFRELNGSATFGVSRGWGTSELLLSRFSTELGVLQQAHAGNFDDLQRAMTTAPTDSSFRYGIARPSQRVSHTTVRWRTVRQGRDASALELVYGFQYNHRREFDAHGPLRFRNEAAFNLKLFTNSLDVRWTHPTWNGLRGTVGTSVLQQGNQTLGKGFLIPGYNLGQGAVYAQESWNRGAWSLTAGARTDLIAQRTIAFDDAGINSPAETRTWPGFSGSLGAAYQWDAGWNASLRVAHAWRPPTVNERYAQGVHHGTAQYELGDATLDPERSLGVEAGLRYAGPSFSFDAAAYSNTIRDFIYLQPRAPVVTLRGTFPAFTYTHTNARLRGLELGTSWNVRSWLELQATANAVRGTNRITNTPLFDMPADRALLQARVVGRGARIGAWHIGAGTVLVRQQDGVPEGTIYTLPTAGYALLQADIGSRGVMLHGHVFDLSLSVTNLLDTRYRDYLSRYRLFVDDAGRDVVLRVRTPIG
jgi:iron complex outermembrane recepter protein